jgi:hypothetical protein
VQEARLVSLIPRTTLHSDSEQARFLKHQSLIIVYCLPTKEKMSFFPSAANKREFAVSVFYLQQTDGSCCFPLVLFSVAEFRKRGDMDMET